MEDKNIYKISLECIISGTLDGDIKRDAILDIPFDTKKESIEMFTKRRLGEYFESYLHCEEKWETIEIMVYWDRKSEFAYEITTGMQIPLLITYQQDMREQSKKDKKLNYNNYSKVAQYGYFGRINYSNEKKSKTDLELSKETLNILKTYIEDNKMQSSEGILLFQSHLHNVIQNSQIYISEILKNMISLLTNENNDEFTTEVYEKRPLVVTKFNVPVACC